MSGKNRVDVAYKPMSMQVGQPSRGTDWTRIYQRTCVYASICPRIVSAEKHSFFYIVPSEAYGYVHSVRKSVEEQRDILAAADRYIKENNM